MIDNKHEYIICAAIHYLELAKDVHSPRNIMSGLVVCGRRHHNIISVMSILGVRTATAPHIQGFMTSKDRFLNREDAGKLAMEIGQVERTQDQEEVPTLISEELY